MNPFMNKLVELGIEPIHGTTFSPFSRKEIAQLQGKASTSLPEAYTRFLAAYGESMFSEEINCAPHGDPLYFGWFYGLLRVLRVLLVAAGF